MAFGFKQDISFQKLQIHEKLSSLGLFPNYCSFVLLFSEIHVIPCPEPSALHQFIASSRNLIH